jgi:5-methylcytosine-specific restriction endonuclease McrA
MKGGAKRLGCTLDEYLLIRGAGFRFCKVCKEWKPIALFCVDASRNEGVSTKCRRCVKVTAGPLRVERLARATIGDGWCRDCKDWRRDRQAVRRGICRACQNVRDRDRYKSDADYRSRRQNHVYTRKRRIEAVPPDGAELLLDMFAGSCAYCESPADTWDHLSPVSQGGRTAPGNIVPACRSCNSSKSDKDLLRWLAERNIAPTETLIGQLVLQETILCG